MVLRNVDVVTFYRCKMYHIFGYGHFDIFILRQNNLIKFLSHLKLEKLVNSPKLCYE